VLNETDDDNRHCSDRLGVAGLVFQGVSYTTREKVVDIGGIQVTTETRKTIPIPLIVGGVA